LAQSLPATPEKELVVPDRPAGIGAELILDILHTLRVKKRPRVEIGVAQILVHGSVELVAPALGGHIDNGPGVAAVFRAVKAGEPFDLLQEVEARLAVAMGSVVQAVGGLDAIHQQFIAAAARAVDAYTVAAGSRRIRVKDTAGHASRGA